MFTFDDSKKWISQVSFVSKLLEDVCWQNENINPYREGATDKPRRVVTDRMMDLHQSYKAARTEGDKEQGATARVGRGTMGSVMCLREALMRLAGLETSWARGADGGIVLGTRDRKQKGKTEPIGKCESIIIQHYLLH